MRALELRIPPVVVVFAVATLMWLADAGLPQFRILRPGFHFVAAYPAGAGILISVLGVVSFKRAKTTVNPTKPGSANSLVISGIYQLSRNPMYLGFFLVLCGWMAFLGNLLTLPFPGLFVFYMNRFQILPEEKALERIFGQQFIDYKSKVRRWI
jgi:protein-S-isoprenylcysteine O-methyltransferase Ste14